MADPDLTLLTLENSRLRARLDMPLAHGGGGNHTGGMEERVTRLEVEFEHVRKDLNEIKADLKTTVSQGATMMSQMVTKSALWGMVATVVAVSVGMIALFVGILAYLQALPPTP